MGRRVVFPRIGDRSVISISLTLEHTLIRSHEHSTCAWDFKIYEHTNFKFRLFNLMTCHCSNIIYFCVFNLLIRLSLNFESLISKRLFILRTCLNSQILYPQIRLVCLLFYCFPSSFSTRQLNLLRGISLIWHI